MKNYQDFSMDDIIFENRNKAYGAFQLRREADKNTTYGLLLTSSAFIAATLLALLLPHSGKLDIPKIVQVAPSYVVVDMPEPALQKPISLPKSAGPPPIATGFAEMQPVASLPQTNTTEEPPKQHLLAITSVSSESNLSGTAGSGLTGTGSNESGSGTVNTVASIPEKPKIEKWAEIMPSFVGGNEALMKYLKSRITLDSRDAEMGISGKVVVQFYVDIDGSIKEAKVIKDTAGGRCAEQALAAINAMPRWTPGKQGDKAVRVFYTIPITFQLN